MTAMIITTTIRSTSTAPLMAGSIIGNKFKLEMHGDGVNVEIINVSVTTMTLI